MEFGYRRLFIFQFENFVYSIFLNLQMCRLLLLLLITLTMSLTPAVRADLPILESGGVRIQVVRARWATTQEINSVVAGREKRLAIWLKILNGFTLPPQSWLSEYVRQPELEIPGERNRPGYTQTPNPKPTDNTIILVLDADPRLQEFKYRFQLRRPDKPNEPELVFTGELPASAIEPGVPSVELPVLARGKLGKAQVELLSLGRGAVASSCAIPLPGESIRRLEVITLTLLIKSTDDGAGIPLTEYTWRMKDQNKKPCDFYPYGNSLYWKPNGAPVKQGETVLTLVAQTGYLPETRTTAVEIQAVPGPRKGQSGIWVTGLAPSEPGKLVRLASNELDPGDVVLRLACSFDRKHPLPRSAGQKFPQGVALVVEGRGYFINGRHEVTECSIIGGSDAVLADKDSGTIIPGNIFDPKASPHHWTTIIKPMASPITNGCAVRMVTREVPFKTETVKVFDGIQVPEN